MGGLVSFLLRGAERVFTTSGPERSEGGRARRLKTARAWPRAAQHKFFVLQGDILFYKKLANNNCVFNYLS